MSRFARPLINPQNNRIKIAAKSGDLTWNLRSRALHPQPQAIHWALPLGYLCETDRWATQRKAAVLIVVRAGQVALDEVCQGYKQLSADEFVA